MSPLDVLRILRASGAIVVLRPDDTIQCRAPDGVLTPALVTAMSQHKEALLTLLEWCISRRARRAQANGANLEASDDRFPGFPAFLSA